MESDDVERAAASPDWRTRASVASLLATRWPESSLVQDLLADADDLAVPEAMADALLSEPSAARIRAFVRAYASADAQGDYQRGDVLNDSLRTAVGLRPELLEGLRELADLGPGAREALEW